MNVKINTSGIRSLLHEDNDSIYNAMKKQLSPKAFSLFAERIPGHEYLQWALPGDGWESLSDADVVLAESVRQEYANKVQLVKKEFGAHGAMADKVLAVPDDGYVYYRVSDDGFVDVKLVAWGYQSVNKIKGGSSLVGVKKPKSEAEVSLFICYDRQGLSNKSFRLNKLSKVSDAGGIFYVGMLPVGYQLDVDVDDTHKHFVVAPGANNFVVDCTMYTYVEICVFKEGTPVHAAAVNIAYGKRNETIATDENGMAAITLPLALNECLCDVSVEGETQSRPLSIDKNHFDFNLVVPSPPVIDIKVVVEMDGKPVTGACVSIQCDDLSDEVSADSYGTAHYKIPASYVGKLCVARFEGKRKTCELMPSLNIITFNLESPVSSTEPTFANVAVVVNKDDEPAKGVDVSLTYGDLNLHLVTDDAGVAQTTIPLSSDNDKCIVSVEGNIQESPLQASMNRFFFNLKTTPVQDAAAVVEVVVKKDGNPVKGMDVSFAYGELNQHLVTDDDGVAQTTASLLSDEELCAVSVNGSIQESSLQATVNRFIFNFASSPVHDAAAFVEIVVNKDGEPAKGMEVSLVYGDNDLHLVTDDDGLAETSMSLCSDEVMCSMSVCGNSKKAKLIEGVNRFVFDLKNPSEVPVKSKSFFSIVGDVLFFLLILFLIFLAYVTGGCMLFC